MKMLPAYQFPTTTVFIDDKIEFIAALQDSLRSETSRIRIFDDPKMALSHLMEHATPKDWSKAWTRIYASDNEFESVALEINFSKICSIIDDSDRFSHITTVFIDYQMPDLDGLTFLEKLKGIPVRKVLLTGIADAEIAVKALNQGLIDSYFRKHDTNLLLKIRESIEYNHFLYFSEQSTLINSVIKIFNDADLISSYHQIFNSIKNKYHAIEYYMTDENGSCCFMNNKSERIDLIIRSKEQLISDLPQSESADFKKLPLRTEEDYFYAIECSRANG